MATREVQQSPMFFYGYIIVATCFIICAAVEGMMYSFGIFFEPLLAEFGWTRAMTAGALSLGAILRIPMPFVTGRLTDRFGGRLVLTICGLILGAGYLLMSQIWAMWQLYLVYGMVIGTGYSFYYIPVISIVPRWFVKRRALMMAIVTSGIGVGQLIVPVGANWLISAYGWRTSYLIIGSISMGIIVIAAQFLRKSPSQKGQLPYGESKTKQEGSIEEPEGLSVREAMRTKQFWMYCGIFFSWVFLLSFVMVHSVIHAIGLGLSSASAANIMAIIGITGIIGRLMFGRLSDKIGMKPVLIISFGLLSIGFLILLGAEGMWMIYLFAATFGISYGTVEVLESPIAANLFGLSSLGAVSGAVFAVGSIGIIIWPVIAGYIFDVTGSYHVAILICAAVGIIGTIFSVLLPLVRGKGEQGKL